MGTLAGTEVEIIDEQVGNNEDFVKKREKNTGTEMKTSSSVENDSNGKLRYFFL
jgi:hypothetical protein